MISVRCSDLSVAYAKQQVLKHINLQVMPGECFGLVGENGAGKSSLIKSILDLVAIQGGECQLFGTDHRKVAARENLAFLPDRFAPPYYLTSLEFLQYMAELHGDTVSVGHVKQMLAKLDLSESALQKRVGALSKGMTQKLGLAASFMSNKDLLILDEPMSGLDPKARVLVKQQIKQMKQEDRTVFFSSHMLADVEEIADRMAVLHQGEIHFVGTPEAFKQQYDSQNMEQAYLNCINGDVLSDA